MRPQRQIRCNIDNDIANSCVGLTESAQTIVADWQASAEHTVFDAFDHVASPKGCTGTTELILKYVIKVFIYDGSSLVRAVTNYDIQYGRHNWLLGLLFCAQLYNCSAQDIISGSVIPLVNNYKLVKDYQLQTASFVPEIVLIRGDTLNFLNHF